MKKKALSLMLVLAIILSISVPVFASDVTWIASLDETEVTNDTDQTVVLTLTLDEATAFDAFDYVINCPAGLEIIEFASGDDRITFTGANYNKNYAENQAKVSWNSSDAENVESVAQIAEITVKIPEGAAPGDYTLSFSEINASADYGISWASNDSSNEVTLKVKGAPAVVSGYSVALPVEQSVSIEDTSALTISLSSDDAATYNSYYFELTYDSSKLEYVSATEGASVDSTTPGKLIVTDYGADKAITASVTVNFKGLATGDAEVSLTKANVDQAANAAVQDAAEATVTNGEATIHIGGYSVSLSEGFSGDTAAMPGEDYTFSASDKHYDYTFTATMGGEAADVIDNGNGTFTVKNVSGALVITQTGKTAKTYNVTLTGDGTLTSGATATYLQDYKFSRGNDSGYTYSVSITIGGVSFTGYSVSGTDYTIPGASVIGNIVITITKTEIPPTPVDTYTVTIEGNDTNDASVASATVEKGSSAVLTLTPADGYDYTVTATMGGEKVEAVKSENTYTVSNVTGNVVFTVNKVSDTEVSVSQYLALDEGNVMWLVKATGTLEEGKVFAYGDNPMYYSEKYEAYCWLVISNENENAVKTAAEAAVAKATAEAVAVDYSGDVNGTKLVDVNDAQFVWNMYKVYYKTFDACARLKFLNADVNGDTAVNTEDAAAVVNIFLTGEKA